MFSLTFFQFYPNPPVTLLQQIDGVLEHHDKSFRQSLMENGYDVQDYIWPLLSTVLTEVQKSTYSLVNIVFVLPAFSLHAAHVYI